MRGRASLVGEQARDAALGQLPDESELPERTVNPEELPFGFIVPGFERRRRPREQRRHDAGARAGAPARRGAQAHRREHDAARLGHAASAPAPASRSSRTRVEDYDVVKRLLTEHYAAFERNVDDEEIDDTDPTQKDFLFGALLREMGTLASHDTFLSTIRLAVAVAAPKRSSVITNFYDRFLSGPAARVADAQAALNQGLHQLIQYLSFLRVGPAAPLTTRANAPKLIQTSKELFDHMDRAAIATVERQLLAATPRNRLLWLSHFFHAPLGRRRDRGLRIIAALALAMLAGGAIFLAVRDAIDFHPTYVERQGAGSHERPAKQ